MVREGSSVSSVSRTQRASIGKCNTTRETEMTHQHERRGADQHEARGDALDDAIRGGGGPPRATRGGIQQTCHLLVDACVAHLSLRVFPSPCSLDFSPVHEPPARQRALHLCRVQRAACRVFSPGKVRRPLLVVLSALRERGLARRRPGRGRTPRRFRSVSARVRCLASRALRPLWWRLPWRSGREPRARPIS